MIKNERNPSIVLIGISCKYKSFKNVYLMERIWKLKNVQCGREYTIIVQK